MLDRRHMLAGLAAGSASVTAARAALDADAALLALGRDLDEAVSVFLAFEPAYEAASAARHAAIQANGHRFDAVRGRGDEAFMAAWKEVAGEHDPAITHGNDLMAAVDALVAQIMDARPDTLAGLAVQARAVAFAVSPTPDPDEDKRDWPELVVLRLAANLAALAAAANGRDL